MCPLTSTKIKKIILFHLKKVLNSLKNNTAKIINNL